MIKKTKHPSNKAERRAIERKKKLHSNASPVAKLLFEREQSDAPRTGMLDQQRDGEGPDHQSSS